MKITLAFLFAFGLLVSCSQDEEAMDFVVGEVSVGIRNDATTEQIFEFINTFPFEVEEINLLTFRSGLPVDSLQFMLDALNQKAYTNDGENWFVTGYTHAQTQDLRISLKLYNMDEISNRTDWLGAMQMYQLSENPQPNQPLGVIRFVVPEGEEVQWRNRFKDFPIVAWAERNYIGNISANQ